MNVTTEHLQEILRMMILHHQSHFYVNTENRIALCFNSKPHETDVFSITKENVVAALKNRVK